MWIIKRLWLFLLTNIAVIFLFSLILVLIKYVFGIDVAAMSGASYTGLLIYAAIFWFIWSFFSLAISKWTAKRAYRIVPFTLEDAADLHGKERLVWETVQSISESHGIKMPEVGIYNSQDPNAFATWMSKNSSLVAVSSGLLHYMNEREIEAVVAHEMAHVLNGDMVTMALLQGVMNTFVIFFARILAQVVDNATDGKLWFLWYHAVYIGLQLVLGIFASIIVLAFSRWREYHADAGSARFVGKEKMIAALEALKRMKDIAPKDTWKMATMQISTAKKGWMLSNLFSSHPDLDARIKYLEDLKI